MTLERHVAVLAGEEIIDVVIRPGMSAEDVLRAAGLPTSAWLTKPDGLPFAPTEPVWDRLRDGEKLFATSRADVGGWSAALFDSAVMSVGAGGGAWAY